MIQFSDFGWCSYKVWRPSSLLLLNSSCFQFPSLENDLQLLRQRFLVFKRRHSANFYFGWLRPTVSQLVKCSFFIKNNNKIDLLQSMRNGNWVLLDNVNSAPQEVVERLLSLFEENHLSLFMRAIRLKNLPGTFSTFQFLEWSSSTRVPTTCYNWFMGRNVFSSSKICSTLFCCVQTWYRKFKHRNWFCKYSITPS